jgi:hypothetical protein
MPIAPSFPYYLLANGCGARLDIPGSFSSEAWGNMIREFTQLAQPRIRRGTDDWLDHYDGSHQLFESQRSGTIYWSENLAGRDGMSFLLIATPDTTLEELRALKAHLYDTRDVVQCTTYRIRRWITFPPTTTA